MSDWLDAFPRVALAHAPTPLEPLERLSEALGGPRLWIKRDDCTGLATGGNKTRKLEFLIADARANDADAVITFGAIQSNHARQTAAACAKFGLDCHLILARSVAWDHPEYETNANVLLDELLGARVYRCDPSDAKATAHAVREELTSAGKSVYRIPTGGSNALGALGYVRCARELLEQSAALGFQPDRIVHATSSGGTQAGLMVGMAEAGATEAVLGINVYDPDQDAMQERVRSLASAVCDLGPALDTINTRTLQPEIDHRHLGSGYGQPTSDTIQAIRQLAELEGIVADPVYSGKALGGLIRRIRAGEESMNSNVIFVHTGGVAVEYVYRTAFERPVVRNL
jgi:L-cysteate sulfo-lyase